MMDWFWANMEKGYYLWAPGSHKKFTWVKTPVEYGMEASVHMISEACEPGAAVFGGEGVEIHRLALKEFFPFTTCLKHVICEGVYNDLGELVDSTVHMWEDVEGGCVHITATVQNSKVSAPPAFIIDILKKDPNAKIVPNFLTEHEDFEASQWPVFLPKLYDLWKNHPDPSQNVQAETDDFAPVEDETPFETDSKPPQSASQSEPAKQPTPAAAPEYDDDSRPISDTDDLPF